MPNITLSLPQNVYDEMRSFPEINWSEIARAAIIKRLELYNELNIIAEKSRLTPEDVRKIGRRVKEGITKHIKNDHR